MTHPSSKLFELVELAKDAGQQLEVDWDLIGITQDQTYVALAETVLSQYNQVDTTNPDSMILMAAIVHLAVENMLLQIDILMRDEKD